MNTYSIGYRISKEDTGTFWVGWRVQYRGLAIRSLQLEAVSGHLTPVYRYQVLCLECTIPICFTMSLCSALITKCSTMWNGILDPCAQP
jgi:hypothetical protein